ncbi:MAG TPA: hypothetical protein VK388_18160 [Pyrinomonadaceae bacterium]|nr:hypothetical protein [Pyrinomonadaceae bacterium]
MSDKMRAVLIGGVTLGLLSAIPPISFANMCCCVWVLGGGALASYLYVGRSQTPVLMGQGAELGALSGVVGTIVSHSIGIPLGLILGESFNRFLVKVFDNFSPQAAEEMRKQLEIAAAQTFVQKLPVILATAAFNTVVYIAFATLGGLLGVKLFEKRQMTLNNTMPPPPPSDFGGTPPPTGGAGGYGSFGGGR